MDYCIFAAVVNLLKGLSIGSFGGLVAGDDLICVSSGDRYDWCSS
jgi:hypothetical protein